MGMDDVLAKRVVAIATLDRADDAEPLAAALLAGGLDVMEVTFRTAAAPEAIRRIADGMPGMTIGAGTLLYPDQVTEVVEAGGQFGVTPGLNPDVVRAAAAAGLPILPGVMTPSDVEQAIGLGCRVLKFFPAEPAGGVAFLKAMAGPYAHTGVRFVPLGGVNTSNMGDYLALPVVGAVGGSWLAEKKLIAARDWAAVTERTKEALAIAAQA